MSLQLLLRERKDSLLKKWFDLVTEAYPSQTTEFLRSKKGQFANPVAHSLRSGLESLYDEITGDMQMDKVRAALDEIVRIRAIQDFSPSEAVSFVLILRELFGSEFANTAELDEIRKISSRIDRVLLTAFDVYMQCREDLFEVRVREVEKRNFRLLQVANQLFEMRGSDEFAHVHEEGNQEAGKTEAKN